MEISRLILKRFRNYIDEEINFKKGLNIIVGDNAQGKTNIVEAVTLCCVGKSPKSSNDRELINLENDSAYVKCIANRRIGETSVEIYFTKKDKKRIKVNSIPINKMGELMGSIKAIYFNPDELKLIKDAPEDRRRFLNIDISQLKKNYFYTINKYQQILKQRNNLLKKSSEAALKETLEIWDEQLASEGASIILERQEFCHKLRGFVTDCHGFLTDNREDLQINYASNLKCNLNSKEQIKDELLKKLRENFQKDFNLKYTTVGPHRDDIKMLINGIDIRSYGSQGQQRTAALSLKLAELNLFKEEVGEYPVLILDDVLSELDKNRQIKLLQIATKVQTLLTTAKLDKSLLEGMEYNLIEVEEGLVKK